MQSAAPPAIARRRRSRSTTTSARDRLAASVSKNAKGRPLGRPFGIVQTPELLRVDVEADRREDRLAAAMLPAGASGGKGSWNERKGNGEECGGEGEANCGRVRGH